MNKAILGPDLADLISPTYRRLGPRVSQNGTPNGSKWDVRRATLGLGARPEGNPGFGQLYRVDFVCRQSKGLQARLPSFGPGPGAAKRYTGVRGR